MTDIRQQYLALAEQNEDFLPFFSSLASQFMTAFARGKETDMAIIDLLTEAGLNGTATAKQCAVQTLYPHIILPLCDDFSSLGMVEADRILARITTLYRHHDRGHTTNILLNDYGLKTEEQLLARQQRCRDMRAIAAPERIQKIFILSRITIGADVAIISPILQRLKQTMPGAKIIILGPRHLEQIFHGQGRVLSCQYQRNSLLEQRLSYWPHLHAQIKQECRGLQSNEILLLDADSRLSQLGLLPLIAEEATYTLASRHDQAQPQRLADICNCWLDSLLPGSTPSVSRFWLAAGQIAKAHAFFKQFRQNTFKIVINFGVGGDDNKRLADPFEEQLINTLLALDNTLVLLDSGTENTEQLRISILRTKAAKNYPSALVQETEYTPPPFQYGLLQYVGSIGSLAALIEQADLFIGYDSCCQHLATATKTPAIICFAGAANERFSQRWQPQNQHGVTETILIDEQLRHQPSQIVEQITNLANLYRKNQ